MPAPAASAATFDTFRAELTRLVERFDRQHPTLQSAVKKTDREIDQLVYQLYALPPKRSPSSKAPLALSRHP